MKAHGPICGYDLAALAMDFLSQDPMIGPGVSEDLQQENITIQPQLLSNCPTIIEHPFAADALPFHPRLENNIQLSSGHDTNYPAFENLDGSAASLLLHSPDALHHVGNLPPTLYQVPQQPSCQHQANTGKRARHDEIAEISLPNVSAETALPEGNPYQEQYLPGWSGDYTTPGSNIQNGLSGPDALGLSFMGGWSTSIFSNFIPTASPKLEFGTLALEPSNKKPRPLSSVKPRHHELRPKRPSRHSTPPTSHPTITRSQSLGVKVKQQSNQAKTSRLLACPFYKSNRQKHHDCLKYELRRGKDVKQHIYRKHVQPEFSCSRCYEIFSTSKDKHDHDRNVPQCKGQRPPQFDGISERQRQDLNCSTSRGQSIEEQWFSTWDILFPGEPRPKSCYLDNYLNEVMSQIRDFWDRKRDTILPDILDDSHVNVVNPGLLNTMMGTIFDKFQSEMSIPATEMNKTPLVPEHTSQQPAEMPDAIQEELSQEIHPTNASQDSQEDSQLETNFMASDQVEFDGGDGMLKDWEFMFDLDSPPTSSA